MANERGRPHQITVMLSDEERDHVEEEANELGTSRPSYIRMLIRADMRKQNKPLGAVRQ